MVYDGQGYTFTARRRVRNDAPVKYEQYADVTFRTNTSYKFFHEGGLPPKEVIWESEHVEKIVGFCTGMDATKETFIHPVGKTIFGLILMALG